MPESKKAPLRAILESIWAKTFGIAKKLLMYSIPLSPTRFFS